MRCVTNGRLVALLLALGGALGPAATAEAAVPQKNAQPPTSTLQEGDGGGAVLALNRRLFSLHFLPSVGGDTYGAATTDGVIAFQKWVGLPRDGVDGPQTQARLAKASIPTPLLQQGGKRVEVSISRQVGLEVNDGHVLWVFPVSTARPGYTTPLGRYHVFAKYLDSWSVPYREWMPYASYFNGGIALHGLAFVPPYPDSHGCVRIPLEFAPTVYQFDTVGTEVDVLP